MRAIYVDDAVIRQDARGRFKIAADAVDPLARLGASEYLAAREVLTITRPR